MKYGKLLFTGLLVLIVWVQAPALDRTWNFFETSGRQMVISGMGMGSRNELQYNPATLSIVNDGLLDSVLVQAVVKMPMELAPPSAVRLYSPTQTFTLTAPTTIVSDEGYFYEATLDPTTQVSTLITGDGSATYKTPRAFVAYQYRRTNIPAINIGKMVNQEIYWDDGELPTWTETFTVPASLNPRNIEVVVVMTEKDSNTGRNILIRAEAGSTSHEITPTTPTLGDEMSIHTLTLAAVAGNITTVRVTVTSPDNTGDSVFWNAVNITTYPDMDFGDAPNQFPTVLPNGARHIIIPGCHLGQIIDAESDGQPHDQANGDDGAGSDDEDGVVFLNSVMQGHSVTINVTSTCTACLNAWIDFNGDYDWIDGSEHIITDRMLSVGTNAITFMVPITGRPDLKAFARFRLSDECGIGFSGLAYGGEVEDYLIDVFTPVELSSFHANVKSNGVELEWITQSETDNLGFQIYRSSYANGPFECLTVNMIKGSLTTTSEQRYSYMDQSVEEGNTYYYRLGDISASGVLQMHEVIKVETQLPNEFLLEQNYPNPFNANTIIPFKLPMSGMVHIAVYNMQGQLVANLVHDILQAGSHYVLWDGRNQRGQSVGNGIYLCRFESNGIKQTVQLSLIK